MSVTTIEWTDRTWNPVRGCSRVSPGCDNCYAMGVAHRFSNRAVQDPSGDRSLDKPAGPYHGLTTIRRGKVDWTGVARFIPDQLAAPLSWRKPQRVFVNSMSDLFHESLTNEEIAAVFGVMAACPQHTFQVLTKRPKRAMEWFKWVSELAAGVLGGDGENRICLTIADRHMKRDRHVVYQPWPLPNVWLGVSAENQETYNARVPILAHKCPAAVRFVSLEPMLGPIDLRGTGHIHLDWVIIGGESGNGARPCALEWIEALVADCAESGIACFVKQLGAVVVSEHRACDTDQEAKRDFGFNSRWLWQAGLKDRKGGDTAEWPEALRVRQFPEAHQ